MSNFFALENVRNDIWCDNLIKYVQRSYDPVDATVGFAGARIDEHFRKSTLRWLNPFIEKEIHELIWNNVAWVNRELFGFDINGIYDIQFTEYHGDPNVPAGYHWHHDIDWNDPRKTSRKLSFVMFMNDDTDYEGGKLEFQDFALPERFKQKAGNAIIFPSYYQHRVTPVTKGNRYSLVSWVEGPKWR